MNVNGVSPNLLCAGPVKSIAQLPGTSPNFGWASDFLFHLPRKMYRIYREYCNSEPFSRCCEKPGKWLKLGFVRLCMCIDVVEIWFGIAYEQIASIFDSYLPSTYLIFRFRMIT